MKKFTKEITALLTTVAVGISASATIASAEETASANNTYTPEMVKKYADTVTIGTSGNVNSSVPISQYAVDAPQITTTTIPPLAGTSTSSKTTTSTTTTTRTIGTSTTFTTTTTIPPLAGTSTSSKTTEIIPDNVTLYGDANCDDCVDISDVVLLKSWLLNSQRYEVSEQGLANSDVQETGNGVNTNDIIAIQQYTLKIIGKLPVE